MFAGGASGSIWPMSEIPSESPETPRPPATPAPRPTRARRSGGLVFVLVVLAALTVAAWHWGPTLSSRLGGSAGAQQAAQAEAAEQRLRALEEELAGLRQALRQAERRIGDTVSGQRVLREEVLGIGERAALAEDAIGRLGETRPAADAPLRLDEVELLLHIGQQRLQLANDRDGALRAYVLANQLVASLDQPAYISLRQSLGQELGALRALDEDPRDLALGGLDAFEAGLASLQPRFDDGSVHRGDDQADGRTGAARLLQQMVRVSRSSEQAFVAPDQRGLIEVVLTLELALARGAAERRDGERFSASLERIDALLPQLYADTEALGERRRRLRELAGTPLTLSLPVLGSTLEQLRQLRAVRDPAAMGEVE